ncbi:MAG: hypothetical protein A2511_00425 [Deltaproteobacteria bacterium RIFOXYD12_FULL_50_9]|nr:MAG: hypothetical protein A2511_00425 [Deltaproteobacteria bacterium RIFOXYD12_FULL_50_9]
MKSQALSIIILLIAITAHADEIAFPTDWRLPTDEESEKGMLKWRNKDSNRYLAAIADFNGDGKNDKALMLVNDKTNKMRLYVFLSYYNNAIQAIILNEFEPKSWVSAMGVSVANPGKYETACGKGYFECGPNESEILELTRPAINFLKYESANSFFYWNDKTNNFLQVQMSD